MAIDLFSMKWIVAYILDNQTSNILIMYNTKYHELHSKTTYAQRHIIWLCWVRGAAELAIITSNIYHG